MNHRDAEQMELSPRLCASAVEFTMAKHREHLWTCHACKQPKPLAGFDRKRRLCADCQTRPDCEVLLTQSRQSWDRLPPWRIRQLQEMAGGNN